MENKLSLQELEYDKKDINDINQEIEKLREEIPSILLRESEFDITSPDYFSEIIAETLLMKIKKNKGVLELTSNISKEDAILLEENKTTLNLLRDQGMSKIWISVVGDDGNTYGFIENPFEDFGKLRPAHIFYTILNLLALIQPENAGFSFGDGLKDRYTFKGITDYEINKDINPEYCQITLKINAKKLLK